MDYRISEHALLLRSNLDSFLDERMPWPDGAHSEAAWQELAKSGWLEAFVEARRDGTPESMVDVAHLVEGFGWRPIPGPVAMTAGFVLPLLDAIDGPVEDVLSGSIVTAALPQLSADGLSASWSYRDQELEAQTGTAGTTVSGRLRSVPAASVASLIVVPIQIDGRSGLALVPVSASTVELCALDSIDLRQGTCDVTFRDAAVSVIFDADVVPAAVHSAALALSQFLDAEAVGAAAAVTRRTVAYVTDRKQFERPIGSFQAVRHRIADMATATETSRSMTVQGAWAVANDAPDSLIDVLASRLYISSSLVAVCEGAIQCHGGMGFTWETGIHVWYRAAIATRPWLSDANGIRTTLAAYLENKYAG
jgi:alkylation response protein AidB-like acyl-CoA dehydrogenase